MSKMLIFFMSKNVKIDILPLYIYKIVRISLVLKFDINKKIGNFTLFIE